MGGGGGVPDRPRLKLAARTVPVDSTDSAADDSADSAPKANPFGGARPVAVKEVEDKAEAKPEAKEERKQREAPTGPRPSDADTWAKKGAPAAPDVAPKANGGGAEGRGPPKLSLAKRTVPVSESAAGGAGGNSLFGGARPRELALEEKGRDWRKVCAFLHTRLSAVYVGFHADASSLEEERLLGVYCFFE